MGNSGAAQFAGLLNNLSVAVFIASVILIIYLSARHIRFSNRRRSITFRSRNHLTEENPTIIDMPVGLQREVIEVLPLFVYKPEQMRIVIECAVCLSEFQENEEGRILPNCNHRFHIGCIDMWLFSHSTCPVCRDKIGGFSPQTRTELPASENLRAVSGSADMDEPNPLPETAVDISA